MFFKTVSRSAVSVLGFVFALSICIGLSGSIALADDDWDLCGNNDEFTTEFRLQDCEFKDQGRNPYFILKPGYRVELVGEEEKSVETVLYDTKWIKYDGRWIKTRVLEERAFEEDKLVEISLNWFAICKQTNAVYYFGEDSRDCDLQETGGFHPEDESLCANEEDPDESGSWEAGVNSALPGLMMSGTPLLGAKYFQEIAPDLYPEDPEEPDHAVDRGQIEEMGLDWPGDEVEIDVDFGFEGCIRIVDTNPAEGECAVDEDDEGEPDTKIYCPEIGLVQDQELVLVEYGFIDDDDDDDDHKRWRRRYHRHWH